MEFQRSPISYPDPVVPVVAVTHASGLPQAFHQHTDADWELCYVASGAARYRLGDTEWHIEAGQLLTIQPDEPHACLSWCGDRSFLVFRGDLLRGLSFPMRRGASGALEVNGVCIPPCVRIALAHRATVCSLIGRLQAECFGGQPTKGTMCAVLVAQLLLELERDAREATMQAPLCVGRVACQTIEDLCREVRTQLGHPWTRAEMARRSGYSATHLSVLFPLVTGLSPCQWLVRQRVEKACELLAQSDRTVVDVAAQVGFGSRSQFHRVFRKLLRVTPSGYRAIVRHEA